MIAIVQKTKPTDSKPARWKASCDHGVAYVPVVQHGPQDALDELVRIYDLDVDGWRYVGAVGDGQAWTSEAPDVPAAERKQEQTRSGLASLFVGALFLACALIGLSRACREPVARERDCFERRTAAYNEAVCRGSAYERERCRNAAWSAVGCR